MGPRRFAALVERAEAIQQGMGEERLSVDHLVMALAQVPRFSEIIQCAGACHIP